MDALKKWKGEMDSAKNWIGEMEASKGSIEAKGKMVASKKWVVEMDASKGPGWIHLEAAGSTPFNKSAWFDAPPIVEPVIPKPTKSSLAVAAGSNLLKVLFKVIKVYERLYTVDDDQTKYTFSELRSLITDVKRGLLSLEQEPVQSNRARWADGSLHNDLQWAAEDMAQAVTSRPPWSFSTICDKVSRLKVGSAISLQIKVPIIILGGDIKEKEELESYLHRLSIALTGGRVDQSGVAVAQLDLDTAIAITRSMESKELFADVLAILEGGRDGRIEIKWPPFPDELVALLACLEHSETLSALPPPAESWGRYFLDGEHEALDGSRREVGFRIMTAIGNCRSLREISLNPLSERGKYRVRIEEFSRLLMGWLRHRSGAGYLELERLNLYWVAGFGTTQVCHALAAAVLSSRSRLEHLDMQGVGLSVEGLGHSSAALLSGHLSLRVLFLDDNPMIGGAAGAQHLFHILTFAYLRTLGLSGIGMDAEGAELIAQGVARTETLEHLRIGYDRDKNPEQAAMLMPLLTVFTRFVDDVPIPWEQQSRWSSITELHLEVTGLAGGNDSVVEAKLAQVVTHVLERNITLRLLRVTSFFVRRGLWALAHNTSIHTLEVVHQHSQDIEEELDPLLVSILHKCKKVKVLQLVFEKPYGPSKFTKAFFQGLGNDLGIKRLVLDGWDGLDDHMFQDLILSLSSNTNLEEISIKGTAWETQGNKGMLLAAAVGMEPQMRVLIAELESNSPVLNELPSVDLWGSYFDIDCACLGQRYQCRKCERRPEWHWALRLRLLTAVGSCRTLRKIHLNPDRPRISETTDRGVKMEEAIAFLTGLQDNPVLQELDLGGYHGFVQTEACLRALTLVISRSHRSLDFLGLRYVGLRAEGLGAIAAALPRKGSSILSRLDLCGNKVGNAVGAQHLVDILSNMPTLQGLAISSHGMDKEGAVVIAKALAHTTTLTRLMIEHDYRYGPKDRLGTLLQALVWPYDFDSETATTASSASETCSPGSHHAQDRRRPAFNVSITTLVLECLNHRWEKVDPQLPRVLANVLRSNRALDELSVSSFFVTRGLGALPDYNSSITKLQVSHMKNADDGDMGPGLITILEGCTTVQELQLQFGKPFGPCDFTKKFFQGLQKNTSIKTLVLDGWDGLDEDMFCDLIRSLGPDSNSVLENISIVETSWESQGKGEHIQDALARNARRSRNRSIAKRQDSPEVPPSVMSPTTTAAAAQGPVPVPGPDNDLEEGENTDIDEVRPDIVAKGFSNHFNEDFDGQRVLCLFHKDVYVDEFHFFFYHDQGMALLLGLGLRYAKVVVEANLCNIRVYLEEDEKMWRSRWGTRKVHLFTPIIFEHQEENYSDHKVQTYSADAAAEQFGIGILNSDMQVIKPMGLHFNIPQLDIYGKGTCPLLVLTKTFVMQYNQLPSSSIQVYTSDNGTEAGGTSQSISSGQVFETTRNGDNACKAPGAIKEVSLSPLQKAQQDLLTDSKATEAMKGKVFEITIILDYEKFKLKATKPDTDLSFEAPEDDLKLSLESLGLKLHDVMDLKDSYIQCEMKLIFWEEADTRHIEVRFDVEYQLKSMVGVQYRPECPFDHFGWFHDGLLIQFECKDGFEHCHIGKQSIYSILQRSEGKTFSSNTASQGSPQSRNLNFGVTVGPQLAQVDVHYDGTRGKTTSKDQTFGGETSNGMYL